MNHSRQLAAALACALTLGLFGGQALADEPIKTGVITQPPLLISPAPVDNSPQQPPLHNELPRPTDSQRESMILEEAPISPDVQAEDSKGTVSFHNLAKRIRENNLNYQALEHSIDAVNDVNLDRMEEQLELAVLGLNGQIQQLKNTSDTLTELTNAGLTNTASSLALQSQAAVSMLTAQLQSTQATLSDLSSGKTAADLAVATDQLRQGQEQIVLGGETLYLSLLGLEQTHQSLNRQLAALERTISQLEVRYEMGQISALTLAETRAGRTALGSGIQTLEMNMTNMRRQLEAMIGAEITGTIQLQPVYAVTAQQLDSMDWDRDWKDLKKKSYALKTITITGGGNGIEDYYADQADELNRKATTQSQELALRALFDQITDQQQVLAAAKTTLAVKEDSLTAAQIKYEQGTISHHALLDIRDARDEAQDKVDTAAIDLFTSYNNYRWAVGHGILN